MPVSGRLSFSSRSSSSGSDKGRNSSVIFYSDAGLDRAADLRKDPAWLSEAFKSREALVVPVWNGKSLVRGERALMLSPKMLGIVWDEHGGGAAEPIFLGLSKSSNAPIFAFDITYHDCMVGVEDPMLPGSLKADWVELRREGPRLPATEAGLLALGRGMVEWQSRHQFCGRCRARMAVREAGHSLICSSGHCGNIVHPRLDPAVIMLISCGNFVLLGRQKRWEAGRYSLLAGFVEIGETMEMAVAREVHEEAGVDVDMATVRYVASQPWPFPSSLMIGFTAEALPNSEHVAEPSSPPEEGNQKGDNHPNLLPWMRTSVFDVNRLPPIDTHNDELEDARWVHRDWLRVAFADRDSPVLQGAKFSTPGSYAISRWLLNWWVKGAAVPTVDWPGAQVPTVNIDVGVFKYVLMVLHDDNGNEKLVVRGNRSCGFHMDVFEACVAEVQPLGLKVKEIGGGRIQHSAEERSIIAYGYSQAFGQADHEITASLLRIWFPLYHSIAISYEGY